MWCVAFLDWFGSADPDTPEFPLVTPVIPTTLPEPHFIHQPALNKNTAKKEINLENYNSKVH